MKLLKGHIDFSNWIAAISRSDFRHLASLDKGAYAGFRSSADGGVDVTIRIKFTIVCYVDMWSIIMIIKVEVVTMQFREPVPKFTSKGAVVESV